MLDHSELFSIAAYKILLQFYYLLIPYHLMRVHLNRALRVLIHRFYLHFHSLSSHNAIGEQKHNLKYSLGFDLCKLALFISIFHRLNTINTFSLAIFGCKCPKQNHNIIIKYMKIQCML